MRETIQAKLDELTSVDSGVLIPEGIIEVDKTYFGYEVQQNYVASDFSQNEIIRVSFIGFVIRKETDLENTLEIVDEAVSNIKTKFKELNFKVSSQDVSLQNEIRKIKITGYVYFNEINNTLIF